jgi:hypothetical protein
MARTRQRRNMRRMVPEYTPTCTPLSLLNLSSREVVGVALSLLPSASILQY